MGKKHLALAIILVLILVAGCGTKGEEQNPVYSDENVEPEATNNSRIAELFGNDQEAWWLEIKTQEEFDTGPSDFIMKIAYQQGMTYTEIENQVANVCTLYKDNVYYTILYDEASYIISPTNEIGDVIGMPQHYGWLITGDEVIDGVEYEFEEYLESGETVRYYFLGDELKYLRNSSGLSEVLGYGTEVEAEWFEIPANFREIGSEPIIESDETTSDEAE